jgi:hypothetical protein
MKADLPRKPYRPPVLQEWGSLEEMTLNVGRTGSVDGGRLNNRKQTRA